MSANMRPHVLFYDTVEVTEVKRLALVERIMRKGEKRKLEFQIARNPRTRREYALGRVQELIEQIT
jgi:hypothetical protein